MDQKIVGPWQFRIWIASIATVVLSVALVMVSVLPSEADGLTPASDEPVITDLGSANFTVNVRSAEFGKAPDGSDVVFVISNGTPATFTMVTLDGEQLFAQSLEGFDLGGWATQADDGRVYFTARSGSVAGLFIFDPATFDLKQLDVDLKGQRVLYEGTFDDQGILYFGTYPDAMVMAYDSRAGELSDFGSVTDDAAYVFSLGIVGDEIWAGTGPIPHLYRIDPGTGSQTELEPPNDVMENTDWFIGIEPRGEYVFVRLSPRGGYDMAVYHLGEDRWLDRLIEGTFDTPVSEVIDGKVYYLIDDVLTGFDLDTESEFSTGFESSWIHEAMSEAVGTYDFTIAELDGPEFAGPTAVGLNTDGELWKYELGSGDAQLVTADVLGSPAGAHAIGVGPDGAVYMTAYLSSGAMSRIDPETQEVEYGRGPKQGDAIITHQDQLVVSSYPGAGVHMGSIDEGWGWSAMTQVLQLERGSPHYQDRIFALESAGERVAVGSVPDYGRLGGALTLVNPETGDYEFYRNVVKDQSIVSLAYDDGLIYGGSSIHGGIDSTPTADEAELFIWDVEAGELIASKVAVPGAEIINQVTVGPHGDIWGLTDNGVVFIVDRKTNEVTESIETGLQTSNVWGRTTSLYVNEQDGQVYGNSGGALFRISPASYNLEILVDSGVRESAVDGRGQIYFADSVNVFAYDQPPGEPEMIVVRPAQVTFVDEPSVEDDIYRVPESKGVEYLLDREVIEAGTYPGVGTVTITARAIDGYVFAEGAATEWTHTFDDSPTPIPTGQPTEPDVPAAPEDDTSGDGLSDGSDSEALPSTGIGLLSALLGSGLLIIVGGILRRGPQQSARSKE